MYNHSVSKGWFASMHVHDVCGVPNCSHSSVHLSSHRSRHVHDVGCVLSTHWTWYSNTNLVVINCVMRSRYMHVVDVHVCTITPSSQWYYGALYAKSTTWTNRLSTSIVQSIHARLRRVLCAPSLPPSSLLYVVDVHICTVQLIHLIQQYTS